MLKFSQFLLGIKLYYIFVKTDQRSWIVSSLKLQFSEFWLFAQEVHFCLQIFKNFRSKCWSPSVSYCVILISVLSTVYVNMVQNTIKITNKLMSGLHCGPSHQMIMNRPIYTIIHVLRKFNSSKNKKNNSFNQGYNFWIIRHYPNFICKICHSLALHQHDLKRDFGPRNNTYNKGFFQVCWWFSYSNLKFSNEF